jgi:hypothetical protein
MTDSLNKKQARLSALLRLTYCTVVFCLLYYNLFAQRNYAKIDTVKMSVNIGVFTDFDPTDPANSRRIDYKNIIIIKPKKERFNITSLNKPTFKPTFNGIFIIDDDQLLNYAIISVITGKFHSTNDLFLHRLKFQLVPQGMGKYKYFCGFSAKAKWIKYTFDNFEALGIINQNQKKLYEKNAYHKNGTAYNYYVLKELIKVKTFY